MKKFSVLFLFLLLLSFSANSFGAINWVAGTKADPSWDVAANWGGTVPGSADVASIKTADGDPNDPVTAIQLYCRRVTIETMFDTLKNTLGAMAYHFWSHYLSRASRRPKKKKDQEQDSTNPTRTNNTFAAIEKFVNLQLLVLGMLQLIAKQFPTQVKTKSGCWLRTFSSNTPSEFVTRIALVNLFKNHLCGFPKDWITQLIRQKQKERKNKGVDKEAA